MSRETEDGTTTWENTYNADGLRTKRTDGTNTYQYYYCDGDLVSMSYNGSNMYFSYTPDGVPYIIVYQKTSYMYLTNLQGDVMAIITTAGEVVVEYAYDAWGNVIDITASDGYEDLANDNPLRYRGYTYDRETQLYYLQSRYYDPELGRFINADNGFYSEGDSNPITFNLYAYCLNNPVNRTDPTGNWSIWATVGIAVGAVICIAAVTVLTCGVGTATLAGAVAVGAAKGALIGAAIGTTVGAGVGYAATGTIEGALEGAAIGFGAGAVVGAVAGAKAGAGSWYNSIAKEFTNAGSSEVVLGRSGTYEAVAQSRGSTYFHATDARWTEVHDMFGVGDRGMWNINKAFLNQQISAGSTFALANNPMISGGYYFMKEVAYLASKGISMLPIF